MNLSIRGIFLLSSWLITGVNLFSQYYVKFKGDSIAFEKDSVVLALDNIISENLHWEISKDSVTWESLNKTNDTLVIRIHDNYFYRAVLEEGTCYPIKSDVAFAGYKSVEVSDNTVVIDSTGGVYILPSGIKLVVPPGAVLNNVGVTFNLLDSINAELKIPFELDTGRVFCAGIYCEPNATEFLKPIKITIPAPNYGHNDLPYLYTYDPISGYWTKYAGDLLCSEYAQSIEFTTDKIASTRVQLLKDVFDFDESSISAKNSEDCEEGYIKIGDSIVCCTEGYVHYRSEASDIISQVGSRECFVSSDKLTVKKLECPDQPVNVSIIEEIGKDCTPEVEDNLDILECIKKGESKTIEVKVTIGGEPLEKQDVQFDNLPEGLSIQNDKFQDFTDENGIATFTITCNVEDFHGTVFYKVYYKYFLEIIEASDGTFSEKSNNYERYGIIPESHLIKECPRIISIKVLAERDLKVGDTTRIECDCRDQYGYPIDCGHVEYTLSDVYTFPASNIISVNSEGLVTALKPGLATVQARSGDVVSDYERGTFSIAYEGDLKDLSITFDNNIYKKCGCDLDFYNPPYEWTWWVVSFIGSYHMTLYLYPDYIPYVILEGEGIITYSITGSTHCTGASFNDPVKSYASDNSLYLLPPESGFATADNVIEGKEFNIRFGWVTEIPSQWRFRSLRGKAKMINPHEIEFTIMDFEPDVCIFKDVEGSCILK